MTQWGKCSDDGKWTRFFGELSPNSKGNHQRLPGGSGISAAACSVGGKWPRSRREEKEAIKQHGGNDEETIVFSNSPGSLVWLFSESSLPTVVPDFLSTDPLGNISANKPVRFIIERLERWLSSQGPVLLFQRLQVQVSAPMLGGPWPLVSTILSDLMTSSDTSCTMHAHMHTHVCMHVHTHT